MRDNAWGEKKDTQESLHSIKASCRLYTPPQTVHFTTTCHPLA